MLDAGGLGRGLHVSSRGTARVEAITVRRGAAALGGAVLSDYGLRLWNCRFLENHATTSGGALYMANGALLESCVFLDNSASSGGAVYLAATGETPFTSCTFGRNSSSGNGGALFSSFSTPRLVGCIAYENSATRGGVVSVEAGSIFSMSRSTFAYNTATTSGSGIYIESTQGVQVLESIVAFGTGLAIGCGPTLELGVSCTNIFGNAGGDWTSCLLTLRNRYGNFSDDPLFCDAQNGDVHLGECSSSLPSSNPCQTQIGALGYGCATPGVCVKTIPPGLLVTGDGITRSSPVGFRWAPGTTHTIGTISPQVVHGDSRYDFVSWSDGGSIEHGVVAAGQIVTAAFDSTFRVVALAFPDGAGTVWPADGWYAAGTTLQVHVDPYSGWGLDQWYGFGNGSYSGRDSVATVVANGPIAQHAMLWQPVPVSITSNAPGARVSLQGVTYTTPVTIVWGKQHPLDVSADSLQDASPGTRLRFGAWSDSLPRSHQVMVGDQPLQLGITFATQHELTFEPTTCGTLQPGNSWYDHGAAVTIRAIPDYTCQFVRWVGSGDGSFTGTQNPAVVTINGPVHEAAVLQSLQHGYELRISASDTDPGVNVGTPTGGVRPLYLWLTCAQRGISAFEADVLATLPVAGFEPRPGVFNVGGPTSLLIAIAGCPSGEDVNFLVGAWTVVDTGGTICLGPSSADGIIGAVDCDPIAPVFWPDPIVVGYASTGAPPCSLGTNGCTAAPVAIDMSQLAATVGDHLVRVTWTTASQSNQQGFYVDRRALGEDFRRLTADLVRGTVGAYVYEDRDVLGDRTYDYRVVDVDTSGRETFHGPVRVTTPSWPPLRTGLAGVQPNPFVERVVIRFGLLQPSRASVSVFDVTGRLVRRLVDGVQIPGSHDVTWNGTDSAEHAVAPGVYFVRFNSPDRTETTKIVRLGRR
ncbi:MAG: T9SS type A sorting domain-containing protein [bacterium]